MEDSKGSNRSGQGVIPWVSYAPCYEMLNNGPGKVTFTVTMTPFGPNGEPYEVAGATTPPETFGVLGSRLGCGIPSVRDYNSMHRDATKYRLRLDMSYEDGTAGFLEKEAALDTLTAPPVLGVVISEFRPRGPRGVADEFVELQNISSSTITMSSWSIDGWFASDPTSVFTMVRGLTGPIGPGCHFLLTPPGPNTVFTRVDGVQSDGPLFGGNESFAGIALRNAAGQVLDQVGMRGDSVFKEITWLDPLNSDTNRSHMRVGADTNDNARDFRGVSPSNPQNSSTCTAPAALASRPR